MRITFNSLNRHMQYVIQNRYSDLARLQEQLSTGRRLLRPSDDPVDVANALKLKSKITALKQYGTNLNDGLAFMSVTDTAMQSMNDIFQRLRELSIQASNATMTINERQFIQKEVEQLTRQVISLADTNYKGDYVFAGTQTKIVPYPLAGSVGKTADDYSGFRMAYIDTAGQLRNGFDGSAITNLVPGSFSLELGGATYIEGTDYTVDYVNGIVTTINPAIDQTAVPSSPPSPNYALGGYSINFEYIGVPRDIYGDPVTNRGEILREIETGISMPINIPGDEAFKDTASGLDVFKVLIKLGQDLKHDNIPGINEAIDDVDKVFKNVLSVQSKNGAKMNRFEITIGRNEMQFTEATRLLSEIEDAEFAQVASDFSLLETIYNAALKAAAKVIQPSLANFL